MERKKIKTVAVLGAGAVGGYCIWGLSEKLRDNLWVIADGTRKQRLETQGLIINGKQYHLNVHTPQEAKGADLLITAVKTHALPNALDDITAVTDDNTIIMSLLNGVTSEQIIGKRVGIEKVVYSTIRIAAQRIENKIDFQPDSTPGLFYGEPDSSKPSARILAIQEVFNGTPLHHQICTDILHEMWDKFALNISCNLVQAILDVGLGAYEDSEHTAYLSRMLRQEVVAIAAAKGVNISAETKYVGQKWARYSTLQDLDAKRRTEIDIFSGAVVEMGQELGIPTPYNAFAFHAIKALEEKNKGQFSYH